MSALSAIKSSPGFLQPGAAAYCRPVADQRGPEDYKRHLVAELTTRALRRAAGRAAETAGRPGRRKTA